MTCSSSRRLIVTVLPIVLATAATLALASATLAQGGDDPYRVSRWTIYAATGGVSSGGGYTVTGSLAQPATSLAVSQSGYQVAGIWTPHPIEPYPYIYGLPDLEDLIDIGGLGVNYEWINKLPMPQPPTWFPSHINYPNWPTLQPLILPATLALPAPPTVTFQALLSATVDTVPVISDTIALYGDVRDETGAIPDTIADAAGLDITGWDQGANVDFDITMGGTSISEIAVDMVEAGATTMSYLRATYEINVIGPTVFVLVMGLIWIQFILVIRWLIMAMVTIVGVVTRLLELIPGM